jgi:hypothetical protein
MTVFLKQLEFREILNPNICTLTEANERHRLVMNEGVTFFLK